jgi:hypothetical protein
MRVTFSKIKSIRKLKSKFKKKMKRRAKLQVVVGVTSSGYETRIREPKIKLKSKRFPSFSHTIANTAKKVVYASLLNIRNSSVYMLRRQITKIWYYVAHVCKRAQFELLFTLNLLKTKLANMRRGKSIGWLPCAVPLDFGSSKNSSCHWHVRAKYH